MNEELRKALAAYFSEMAKAEGDRDEKTLADAEKVITAAVENTEDGTAGEVVAELSARVEQLTQDLAAEAEERRKEARIRLITPSPLTGLPSRDAAGRLKLRFSHPELSREMFEFAQKIYTDRIRGEKQLTPASDEHGGYVIPESLWSELQIMMEIVGVAADICGSVPLPAGTLRLPRVLELAIAYFKAPGAEAEESISKLGTDSLSAQTLIGLMQTTLEFEEDAAIDVGNFIARAFVYAITKKEDDCMVNGDGTADYGEMTGILNSDRVTLETMDAGDDAFTDLDSFDYLTKMEANVWEPGLDNAKFLMSRSIKALLKRAKDSAGLPIWQPTAGSEPSDLMGYPHRTTGRMPALSASDVSTKFLAFGDFRVGVLIGRRGGYRLDYSPMPGFKTLTSYWRAFERIDMQVRGYTSTEISENADLVNPITVLRTAAE